MAQSFVTDDGIVLYDPGTYVSPKVIANQGGIGTAGILTLIGEADEGPAWSEESDLDKNSFGPSDIDLVQSKYYSGHLVDAFKAAASAANDPAIVGSVAAIKLVKTNLSTKASANLTRNGFGTYASLLAKRAGVLGNSVKYKSEVSQQESAPSTDSFIYCPSLSSATQFFMRVNGGSKKTVTVSALTKPSNLASLLEDYSRGILCEGGAEEIPLTGLSGVSLTAAAPSASTLVITLASGSLFNPAPEIGDVVLVPASGDYGVSHNSAIVGLTGANRGSYVVTAVTNTVSSATLTLKAVNIAGVATEAASGSIDASEDDILSYKPVVISNYTGQDRVVAGTSALNWSCTLNDGTNIVLGITTTNRNWTARPIAGDIMIVPSAFAGIAAGFYMVVSATKNTVSAFRLSNGSSGTTGVETGVVAGFSILKPVIDGLGKSMEIEGDITDIFKTETGDDASFSNSLLVSAAEMVNLFTVTQGSISDVFETGGDIAIKIGCSNDNAVIEVFDDKIEIREGATVILTVMFTDVRSLSSLVDLINSMNDYSAAIGSTKFSSRPLSELDKGVFDISSSAFMPARLKRDAYTWTSAANGSSFLSATLSSRSGLPEVSTPAKFLANGAKGATTSMDFSEAIDACDYVTTNFLVHLFSQDASQDIIDLETDVASTYTIDAINSLVKSSAIRNSAVKARNNRIGLGSRLGSFEEQQEAAGELSSHRFALCMDDQKLVSSDGTIKQYQPWMSAVIAAAMQAAAGYKGIVKKFANTNGVVHRDGSFNSKSSSQREKALRAGLMFMESVNTGGFRWVSDQMTYSVDNNFVFNSLQAVYLADLMTLTLIDRFDRAFVGKSVAEISAIGALGFLESELFNFKRLRWIAASDDAPNGYKNASAKIDGGVLKINVEVKLAGLIYFVPINLFISQVSQSAS